MSIFFDIVMDTIEVFMDDFSVVGDSFDCCLSHLAEVLKRCEDCNLVLNWDNCHFMVKEGIVLGHRILEKGIEVAKAKVEVIDRLVGKGWYCFLDGYLGYNQISISHEYQEKTTFTFPYGTFTFKRMSFGLCKAPATF